jgi:hypothetical protein
LDKLLTDAQNADSREEALCSLMEAAAWINLEAHKAFQVSVGGYPSASLPDRLRDMLGKFAEAVKEVAEAFGGAEYQMTVGIPFSVLGSITLPADSKTP